MKKLALIVMLILTAFYGCENQKVKVVNASDNNYLNVKEVDRPPLIIGVKISSITINKEFNSKLFIDEKGILKKIVILHSAGKNNDKKVIEMLEGYKFKPALKNGKPVKVVMDFRVHKGTDEKGLMPSALMKNFEKSHESQYFVAVEQMPEPIGGIAAIQKKIVYPEVAKRAGIEGRVYVRAFINEKGNVDRAQVIKGIGGGCDEAAVKAVEETKFKPGRQRGKPVKVQVSIPVIFKLSD